MTYFANTLTLSEHFHASLPSRYINALLLPGFVNRLMMFTAQEILES